MQEVSREHTEQALFASSTVPKEVMLEQSLGMGTCHHACY